MFNHITYCKRLIDAGLTEKQAKIMTSMMQDVDKIINNQDEEEEDGNNAV